MSVAVLITCFDEGEFVGAALDSVLAQTARAEIDEIVVIDAGSGPQTLAVVRSLAARDPRVRLLFQSERGGVSRSRNLAAAATRAPLIAFLDGDDLWTPERLARQLAVLDAEPGIGLVYSGYWAFSEGGSDRAVAVYDLSTGRDPTRRYFLHDPPVLPSSILMRRSAFLAVGGFDERCLVFEDTDFCIRLSRAVRMKGLAEPLIRKRYRAGSLSAPGPGLMAHHAYVAFRAATVDPRLMPLAPQRLAARAARLGLVAYYAGDLAWARRYAATALRLSPLQGHALALSALCLAGVAGRRLAAPLIAGKARLHGR